MWWGLELVIVSCQANRYDRKACGQPRGPSIGEPSGPHAVGPSPGWTSKPHEDTDSKKSDEKLAQCLHLPSSKLIADAANADSADFTSSTGLQVTNSVGVAKTADDVRQALDVMSRSDAADCFSQTFDAAIREQTTTGTAPADTTFGKTTVSPESFESLGDRTVAYRVTVPVTTKGVNVSIYIDFIVVQKGRVGITLTALDTLTPMNADASASLLGKVLSRIPAAT